MATKILNAIVQRTGLEKLSVKPNDFVVIRETQMTGVLLELGFLSNLQEELILHTDQFKDNTAEGVFQGIIDFFNPDPSSKMNIFLIGYLPDAGLIKFGSICRQVFLKENQHSSFPSGIRFRA